MCMLRALPTSWCDGHRRDICKALPCPRPRLRPPSGTSNKAELLKNAHGPISTTIARTVINLERAKPFWVLEYVSENNKRKDYEDSFRKYEDVLQVPYYLIFDQEKQDLRVYRYNGEGYVHRC